MRQEEREAEAGVEGAEAPQQAERVCKASPGMEVGLNGACNGDNYSESWGSCVQESETGSRENSWRLCNSPGER